MVLWPQNRRKTNNGIDLARNYRYTYSQHNCQEKNKHKHEADSLHYNSFFRFVLFVLAESCQSNIMLGASTSSHSLCKTSLRSTTSSVCLACLMVTFVYLSWHEKLDENETQWNFISSPLSLIKTHVFALFSLSASNSLSWTWVSYSYS